MTKFDELCAKLKEIFELDKPELDFGIYRIIHTRAKEINAFLETRLAQKVKAALAGNSAAEKAVLEKELNDAIAQAKALGADPNVLPKVQELKAKIAAIGVDEDAEASVYSHLLDFFSRYYDAGDFVSKRRYKDGVYAIPYAGEEVKLHWANADQYYIKSGENFQNYSFKLDDGARVSFKLVTAETAKDNIKDNDAVRCFVLWNPDEAANVEDEERAASLPKTILEDVNGELVVYFQYLKFKKGTKQADLIKDAQEKIAIALGQQKLLIKYNVLALAPTEKEKKRTVLGKHLQQYVAKNTSDYFIHKDLRGFLTRELDFYIKNEMMHLDDVMSAESFKVIEQNLRKIQAVRTIATELITFMAQLEDFQKKLWLKKKFVTQCDYCITMDRVPDELRAEVLANEQQRAEWARLGLPTGEIVSRGDAEMQRVQGELGLDRINKIDRIGGGENPENPVNPVGKIVDARMVDTKFFSDAFKEKLLRSIPNLDEQCDGLLIHADNFQALRLLEIRYSSMVNCIYTDPPYNTNASEILYKNGYKHSCWISLMSERTLVASGLLAHDGVAQFAIDDLEISRLEGLLNEIFGEENKISNIAIYTNPKGRDQGFIAQAHDYAIVYAKDKRVAKTYSFKLSAEEVQRKFSKSGASGEAMRELPLKRTGSEKYRTDRPPMYFPFVVDNETGELNVVLQDEYDKIYDSSSNSFDDEYVNTLKEKYAIEGKSIVLPLSESGEFLRWRWGYRSCVEGVNTGVLVARKVKGGGYAVYQRDVADENVKPKSFWFGERYDASSKGTNILNAIIPANPFNYPKSLYTVVDNLTIGMSGDGFVLDYFAGSGTTAHATIALNREDGGHRKYILIEMGDHFDTVLKPRIEKVVYSPDWKDGKPTAANKGISHCFKYMTLESYEDALNNIELEDKSAGLLEGMKDEYLLTYMLDLESRGSLIKTDDFRHPFDYTLKIAVDSSGASEKRKVDLVETFNYLIGLKVDQYVRAEEKGYAYVDGHNPKGEHVLVFWRDTEKIPNAELNKELEKLGVNPANKEFDLVYVNGDHGVANVTLDGKDEVKVLKIKQLENEFLDKMFEER